MKQTQRRNYAVEEKKNRAQNEPSNVKMAIKKNKHILRMSAQQKERNKRSSRSPQKEWQRINKKNEIQSFELEKKATKAIETVHREREISEFQAKKNYILKQAELKKRQFTLHCHIVRSIQIHWKSEWFACIPNKLTKKKNQSFFLFERIFWWAFFTHSMSTSVYLNRSECVLATNLLSKIHFSSLFFPSRINYHV